MALKPIFLLLNLHSVFILTLTNIKRGYRLRLSMANAPQ